MTPEDFNKWRVMPRVLMTAYYTFFAFTFWEISGWFMDFEFDTITEPTVALAVAGFLVGILTVLAGVLAHLTKNYFHSPSVNGG